MIVILTWLYKLFCKTVGEPVYFIFQNYLLFKIAQLDKRLFLQIVIIVCVIPDVVLSWDVCGEIEVGRFIEHRFGKATYHATYWQIFFSFEKLLIDLGVTVDDKDDNDWVKDPLCVNKVYIIKKVLKSKYLFRKRRGILFVVKQSRQASNQFGP